MHGEDGRSTKMNRKLRIALWGVAGLFVAVTGVGLILPQAISVERSIVIDAPADQIYPLISSFKEGWVAWSPFGKAEDPEMQIRYTGPLAGAGAGQVWDSPKQGDGHMEIVRADKERGVEYELAVMHDRFRMNGSLLCAPAGKGTRVTWRDDIQYGFSPYYRYMGVAVKRPLAAAFEHGLGQLKRVAEARATAAN
jgi:hypothetical protein